jgi:hypothetical protein
MKIVIGAALAAAALLTAPLTAAADPLTYPALKTMVANMGFTPNEIGTAESPKFEASVKTESFNVPVGFEITKSARYIWATASLGPSKLDGEGALLALKRASDIQPTSFWITAKGTLMIGIAIDNRDVKPDTLKFVMDKLAGDVGKTSDVWQAKPAAAKTP